MARFAIVAVIVLGLGLCLTLGASAAVMKARTPRPGAIQNCCKVCRKSQPCGNSCIPWNRICHKEPGCACSG